MVATATAQARHMVAMELASIASTAATNIRSRVITGLNFAAQAVWFAATTDLISPEAVIRIGEDPA